MSVGHFFAMSSIARCQLGIFDARKSYLQKCVHAVRVVRACGICRDCSRRSVHELVKFPSVRNCVRYYPRIHAADFFDGYLPFGRADEFIDELLQTPPSLLTAEDGRTTGLIDPLGSGKHYPYAEQDRL